MTPNITVLPRLSVGIATGDLAQINEGQIQPMKVAESPQRIPQVNDILAMRQYYLYRLFEFSS